MEDPIIPSQGVMRLERYAYVFNMPIFLIDPDGYNPACGPDGIFCNSMGQVLDNSDLYDVLVENYWIDPMPDPYIIYDARYNTQKEWTKFSIIMMKPEGFCSPSMDGKPSANISTRVENYSTMFSWQ